MPHPMPTKAPDPLHVVPSDAPIRHSLWQRYRHLNLTLLDQAVVSGSNFLTMVILARVLGPTDFGCFAMAWMILLLLNILQSGLILFPMLSIGPKQTSTEVPVYYGAACLQQALFTGLCFLMVWAITLGVSHAFPQWPLYGLELPLALASSAFQCQDFVRRLFFAQNRVASALHCDLISYVGQLALLLGLGSVALLTSKLALLILAGTSLLAVLWSLPRVFPLAWPGQAFINVVKQHWQVGSWLTLSQLIHNSGSQGVFMLAGLLLGPRHLGGIQAVVNLCGPINIALQGLQNRIPVQASMQLANHGHAALVRYMMRVTGWLLGFVGLLVLVIVGFQDGLVRWVYGIQYLPYAHWIPWAGLYAMLTAFILPLTLYFRTLEKTRIIALSFLVAAPVSLITAACLLQTLGEFAIILALMVNQLLMAMLLGVAFLGDARVLARRAKEAAS